MATNNSIDLNSQGTVYYNGSGTFSGVDGSTAGFVLTSNGTGVAPSFQSGGGGGYSEGTFTPTLFGGTVTGTTGYTTQQGYYTRIGNTVFITLTLVVSSITGTGDTTIGGLPFTVRNQTDGNWVGSMVFSGTASWAWPPTATSDIVGIFTPNTTTAVINCSGSRTASSPLAAVNNAVSITFSGFYQV